MPKGIFIRSKEIKEKVSKSLLGNKNSLGVKRSEEHKRKISQYWKGRKRSKENCENIRHSKTGKKVPLIGIKQKGSLNHQYGKTPSKETVEKIRKWHINNPNRKFKDTKIEKIVENELIKKGIHFSKQVPLCNVSIVDFYLVDYNVVIECDGDYWHSLPGRKERDENKDKVLRSNGFIVYRFWEHEINRSVEKCVSLIKEIV